MSEKPNEIESLLPHRPPFLFVDEITSAAKDRISARHVFGEGEFFFRGHFPRYPVVPGVILVETMAQSGGAGLRKLGILGDTALFFLATVDKVKFRRQVRPGEEVRSEIENLRVSPRMIKQSGKAYVGEELAAEAEWMCLVGEEGNNAH
ncbi:MAG: 3-hydroxyacyl-ACP dehydratase FabZ [Treponema sp.]|jgi:3-hydroxyacyl-[acyl-carrier-protein] dehydratase|nr:3-hydroxyacyl-ACP dehydratase FabZ [Treponema sp.]